MIFVPLFFWCIYLCICQNPEKQILSAAVSNCTGNGSGALGNFIDRVCRGYVVDFIYFSLIDFPVFNIADMYVVCSGILLVMLVCFRYKNDEDYDFLRIKKD